MRLFWDTKFILKSIFLSVSARRLATTNGGSCKWKNVLFVEKKLLVIDEAWSLLNRVEDASYILEIVKTCRKFNLGLLLINQEVENLLNSEAGKAVLANSAYTLLMRQKSSIIKDVCETFNLSKTEKDFLLTAPIGHGILLIEDDHLELKIVASDEEHKIITTKPDELISHPPKNITPTPGKDITIKLDPSKGFYRKEGLNQNEIDFLIRQGYDISSHVPIGKHRQEEFLLKLDGREGKDHFFMVRSAKEYLNQFTNKVKVFETTKPELRKEKRLLLK